MDRPPPPPTPNPRPMTPGSSPPGDGATPSKIRHTESTLNRAGGPTAAGSPGANPGAPGLRPGAVPVPAPTPVPTPVPVKREIVTFGSTVDSHQEDHWKRQPVKTGTGATHCKTFHSKLTEDALRYMDQLINEWLDAHPDYEVKFITSSIGTFTGKIKEPHLICQVWV